MDADILVVDDEMEIASLVEVYLQSEGFQVRTCGTVADALALTAQRAPDLAVLDVMLPDGSGFDLCARLRKDYHFPVLMLTARTGDADKVTGLTLGADDYLTKPFNPLELVARVKAQLRRYTCYNETDRLEAEVIDIHGLVISHATHQCWLYDQPVNLTPLEFEVLWLLCDNRGQVLSAEQIFEMVWKEKYLERNNTVMVHIRHLRKKLAAVDSSQEFVETVWGVGYRLG